MIATYFILLKLFQQREGRRVQYEVEERMDLFRNPQCLLVGPRSPST